MLDRPATAPAVRVATVVAAAPGAAPTRAAAAPAAAPPHEPRERGRGGTGGGAAGTTAGAVPAKPAAAPPVDRGADGRGETGGVVRSDPDPVGPCDIYAAANTPCGAAHSTARALYSAYTGPLYQVQRASDKTTKDILVGCGGFADSAAQDSFCSGTTCTIPIIYDQSAERKPPPRHVVRVLVAEWRQPGQCRRRQKITGGGTHRLRHQADGFSLERCAIEPA